MNLRDLHYVLAVAETRNFKKASALCHVSQPTLSMQIRKLEDYLGVQLFERTNKSVMITDAGLRIAETAARIVADEQRIIDIARTISDPRAGEWRIGAIPTLASYLFPPLLPILHKSFAKIHFFLIEEKTERLIDQLRSGKIDAAFLALPVDDPTLETFTLFHDPFYLAVSAKNILAKKKSVALDDLQGHKLLLLDDGHCLRDQALSVCHAHGADEDKSFRATSLETLRLMVQADADAMTLMPGIAATANSQLRYIPFTAPKPSRSIGLVTRKTSARKEVITEMARVIRQNTIKGTEKEK